MPNACLRVEGRRGFEAVGFNNYQGLPRRDPLLALVIVIVKGFGDALTKLEIDRGGTSEATVFAGHCRHALGLTRMRI